jgi:hypothetical protein
MNAKVEFLKLISLPNLALEFLDEEFTQAVANSEELQNGFTLATEPEDGCPSECIEAETEVKAYSFYGAPQSGRYVFFPAECTVYKDAEGNHWVKAEAEEEFC